MTKNNENTNRYNEKGSLKNPIFTPQPSSAPESFQNEKHTSSKDLQSPPSLDEHVKNLPKLTPSNSSSTTPPSSSPPPLDKTYQSGDPFSPPPPPLSPEENAYLIDDLPLPPRPDGIKPIDLQRNSSKDLQFVNLENYQEYLLKVVDEQGVNLQIAKGAKINGDDANPPPLTLTKDPKLIALLLPAAMNDFTANINNYLSKPTLLSKILKGFSDSYNYADKKHCDKEALDFAKHIGGIMRDAKLEKGSQPHTKGPNNQDIKLIKKVKNALADLYQKSKAQFSSSPSARDRVKVAIANKIDDNQNHTNAFATKIRESVYKKGNVTNNPNPPITHRKKAIDKSI